MCRGALAELITLCANSAGSREGGVEYTEGSEMGLNSVPQGLLPTPHNVSLLLSSSENRDFIRGEGVEWGVEPGRGELRHTVLVTADTCGGSLVTGTDDFSAGRLSITLAVQERE